MFGKSVNFGCLNLLTWTENGDDFNDCAIDCQNEVTGNCPENCEKFTPISLDE